MRFKDEPCNSKTCPAMAVCMIDNSRYPASGQGLGGMLSPDQNTGPVQGHESDPVKAGSSSHSPGRCEGPQAGGCQGASRQAPAE